MLKYTHIYNNTDISKPYNLCCIESNSYNIGLYVNGIFKQMIAPNKGTKYSFNALAALDVTTDNFIKLLAKGTIEASSYTVADRKSIFNDRNYCCLKSNNSTPIELTNINANSFGQSIALSGDGNTIVIGDISINNYRGGAWIHTKSSTGWESVKVAPNDLVMYDYAGKCVAISADGNTVVIGAPYHNSYRGALYVYTKNGSSWNEHKLAPQILTSSTGFGDSISISSDGTTIFAGAPYANNSSGVLYIYTKTTYSWNEEVFNPNLSTNSFFGYSVDVSGDGTTIIIGAPQQSSYKGACYVCKRNLSNWTAIKLAPIDLATHDSFGHSVSISNDGTTIVIGAPYRNGDKGSIYVYTKNGPTWAYSELKPSGLVALDYFGTSVAIAGKGNTIIVGAPYRHNYVGSSYKYTKENTSWAYVEIYPTNLGASAGFGLSVDISTDGETIAIGAPNNNNYNGTTYIYKPSFATLVDNKIVMDSTASKFYFNPKYFNLPQLYIKLYGAEPTDKEINNSYSIEQQLQMINSKLIMSSSIPIGIDINNFDISLDNNLFRTSGNSYSIAIDNLISLDDYAEVGDKIKLVSGTEKLEFTYSPYTTTTYIEPSTSNSTTARIFHYPVTFYNPNKKVLFSFPLNKGINNLAISKTIGSITYNKSLQVTRT